MILIDTSVLVDVLRDRSKESFERVATVIGAEDLAVAAHTELELPSGARDANEWRRLADYLATITIVRPRDTAWAAAARMYFDLRRNGQTIRSIADVCIAQIAVEHDLLLLHNDRDFEKVATVCSLRHKRIQLRKTP